MSDQFSILHSQFSIRAARSLLAIALGDDAFTPGTLLGDRFRIVSRIGRGGMGEVYRADDLKLGVAVALKFVGDDALQDEVRLGRQVAHPNVCRLYDLAEHEGRPFLVMELVEGEDLTSLIGRLPLRKALDVGREICAGLAAAHDRGVVHGDLKPSNVMIDGRGHVRITDFGMSSLGGSTRGGTPAYMAPEQLAGEVSMRSDVYALGLVLRELLECGGEASALKAVASPPHSKRKPAEVEEAIQRCLAEDPANRPTAREVLAAFPGGDPLDAAVAAGETPSPEMVAAAEDEGRVQWGLWGSIALAGLLGFLTSHRPPGTPAAGTLTAEVYALLLAPVLVAGVIVARRNIRAGRGDLRGARRLAGFVFVCRMLYWLLVAHHVPDVVAESVLLGDALAKALFQAAEVWVGYLAIEPYIRRRSPRLIVGWKRLLDGRVLDRVIGRDLLAGSAVGIFCALIQEPAAADAPDVFYYAARAVFYALFALFLLVLLRALVRNRWVAAAIWLVPAAILFAQPSYVRGGILAALLLAALMRFGLLTAAAAVFVYFILGAL